MTVGEEIRMNILMLGQIADVLTTYMGLQRGFTEGNPLVRVGIKHLGFTGMAVVKLALMTRYMRHASPLTCAISWFGPINNIIGLTTTSPPL